MLVDTDHARALAERLHRGQRDRRSAADRPRSEGRGGGPAGARVVAWLHELLEHTSISARALLAEGLSLDVLRALTLLTRREESHSSASYLAHIQLIAGAVGAGASIARCVKRADLADRALHPAIRADGWSPPYELGLELLREPRPTAPPRPEHP